MTTIIVNHENNQIDEHDFESEISTITIGRRSTNDVCIPNLSVSGMHAKIVISDDSAMIEDLGSTNGTYINGRLISRQQLNDGDDIVMGKTRVTFLQPSLNRAVPSPVIRDDEEIEDEKPLTLAEKAKLHKTDLRPAPIPDMTTQTPTEVTSASAKKGAGTEKAKAETQDEAESVETTTTIESENSDARTPAVAVSSQPAAQPQSPPQKRPGLDDALINGFDQIEGDDVKHAESVIGSTAADEDMVALDNASASAVIEIKNGAKSGQVLPIDKPVTTLGRPGIQIAAIMKKPEGYFLMHIESDENIGPPKLNKSSIGDEPVLLKSGDALNVAGIDVQFMQS